MSMMVSFVLSFFPRDVLDEILNLIDSVSEDFPSYFCQVILKSHAKTIVLHECSDLQRPLKRSCYHRIITKLFFDHNDYLL